MRSEDADSTTRIWLSDPLPRDVAASLRRVAGSDDVCHVAVMPDVHLAGDVCNGTVVATRELIYPLAVGSDLGCGMLAVGIDFPAEALSKEHEAGQLLAGLYARVPAIKHSNATDQMQLPANLSEQALSHSSLEKAKSRDGLLQFGTLGRGNHFVEFQADSDGRLWLMLHSGSRAIGQMISDYHLKLTQPGRSRLGFVEAGQASGRAYLSDLEWAIEYAMQNRLAMAVAIESLIQDLFAASIDWSTLIHSQHNHVRREIHAGVKYWIHRKGALSAQEGEAGVIPGSMGTHSYHVAGRGLLEALRSSSHGAGRRLSRQAARRKISHREFQRQMRDVWFDRRCIDALREESPAVYKDIDGVMRAPEGPYANRSKTASSFDIQRNVKSRAP